MKFIDNIKNNTIVICSNKDKIEILKELSNYNKLYNINFISLNEFINEYNFTYDNKTIYYVMNKYNIKRDIALMYLDNLKYVNDKLYSNKKLDFLVSLKKDLDNNNLLYYDEYFNDYVSNKDIIVYNYDYINKYSLNILNKFNNLTIINKEYKDYKHDVYEFKNINDEVDFVASSICELINNGIDINSIKLCNVNDDYKMIIDKVFNMYNIPVIDSKTTLYSTTASKYLIDNYSNDFNTLIEDMKHKFDSEIVNQIINVLNNYAFTEDKLSIKDLVVYDLKHKYVNKDKLESYVDIVNYNECSDNDYVYLLGFNEGIIPKYKKDEDYLSNNEYLLLGLESINELNIIEKTNVINNIKSIKNLTISYMKTDGKVEYYVSSIINDLKYNIYNKEVSYNYSKVSNNIKLCSMLDSYYKYNILNKDIPLLLNNTNIDYRKYDNSFNKLNSDIMNDLLKDNINLSYSTMENYNECAFKYYIKNLLKLDVYKDKFSTFIGSLFHYALENCLERNIDIETAVKEYLNSSKRELNNKEVFYIDKIKKDIEFALNAIKDQMKYTEFTNESFEEKFEVITQGDITITFTGVIDKMMTYKEDNKLLIALIDYKTYDLTMDLDLLDYGLHMQLPIYLYLSKNKFKNAKFAGIYLQNVIPSDLKHDKKLTQDEKKKLYLKLSGYSNSDEEILSKFDKSYRESNLIKSLGVKQDGSFTVKSKLFSDSDIDNLISISETKINECANNIMNGNFDINPKSHKGKNISCEYCEYKDLCFMKESDVIKVGEDND